MVVLEKAGFAATSLPPFERTSPAIALPDGAPHGSRNMTRRRFRETTRRFCARGTVYPRPLRRGRLLSFERRDEQGQSALKDDRRIAIRHRMTEKILRMSQLLVGLTIHGELNLVA